MALLRYLGELDCFDDLASVVGIEKAEQAYRGKLNYFQDLDSENRQVFGVSDFEAEYVFEENEVISFVVVLPWTEH